ncbi:MAG TPA: M20/M25/M40 family metallo-hydrolase [Acidobacteriaceae bacterium]|jgi:carboxypeptidase Q|nr:M20/M25/M40 family metallo-hydrolase [Acidobacteriaceae bacterium]
MHTPRAAALLALAGAVLALPIAPLSAAPKPDKKARAAATTPDAAPWEVPQPAVEKLDLNAYARIREEGIAHSHVMELASALDDDIGGRLTGSPNMQKANDWTRDQLTRMGLVNAHLEDWGEFGMGWQQINTWVRMTAPDTAPFIAQATPWSPSTSGAVSGAAVNVVIDDEKDFDKYKGKLSGKIVLLGEMRDVPPVDKPLFERYTDKDLEELTTYPSGDQNRDYAKRVAQYLKRYTLRDKIAAFLADEKVAGVVLPSRDGKNSGGSGGTFFDDNGAALGSQPYKAEKAVKVPVVVTAIENYGRVYRLLKANVPVTLEMNVESKVAGDHEHGFDTVAEIPGTDPDLKDQIVMVGGHLDSWASGTGATDNGAGSVVAMEAVRILKALDIHPRRTIRIALWSGEEEGLFGSKGYVSQHFGSYPLATDAESMKMPEFIRKAAGPVETKPEWKTLDVYFNVDNGTGKIRGVYLQGNAAVEPIFRQWIKPLKDLGVTTITMRNTGGTDHLSFDAVGLPGFQFIQDPMDYESRTHHSNMDTYERLQPADLAQIATVEAIFLYNAAMRDEMIPRKPIPHPERRDQQSAPLKDVFPGAVPEPK